MKQNGGGRVQRGKPAIVPDYPISPKIREKKGGGIFFNGIAGKEICCGRCREACSVRISRARARKFF